MRTESTAPLCLPKQISACRCLPSRGLKRACAGTSHVSHSSGANPKRGLLALDHVHFSFLPLSLIFLTVSLSSYTTLPPLPGIRKPRPVSQLVSQQQVTQQFVLPLQPKKEKKERVEREKSDREPALKKNSHKKMR